MIHTRKLCGDFLPKKAVCVCVCVTLHLAVLKLLIIHPGFIHFKKIMMRQRGLIVEFYLELISR